MVSETYTGPDRRQTLRIKYEGSGQISGKATDGLMHAETVHFVNMSEGGACLKTAIPFPDGADPSLTFKIPGLLNIFVRARTKVVWCTLYPTERCYLLGVQFGPLQPYDLTALRSFILTETKKGNKSD
jgi:hypothetical protein